MLPVVCVYFFQFGDADFVRSVMMIVIALCLNCPMGPWSPVFPLNITVDSMGRETKFLEVSLLFLLCLSISVL